MKRDYSSGVRDNVNYFTGFEVEKTPAYDMDTLFVVGCRPLEEVLEKANVQLGDNYPNPIINLKSSREEALLAFSKLKTLEI